MIIPDKCLGPLINLLYNVWFTKWRHKISCMSKADWLLLIDEFWTILEEGRKYPVVEKIGLALLDELDARSEGKY